jgi:16S rRNA (uracil1498-N3)-methyltransferase
MGGNMPRFFVSAEQIDGDKIYIVGDDAFHISRALRMAAGESITVCDEGGVEYDCILEEFLPDRVGARITASKNSETEPPFKAYIYQGLPKGDKLETVIQKSVECGACSIITFESEFCIAKAKPDGEKNKLERRNRIAAEAAKQSGRSILPRVGATVGFDRMLDEAAKADICLFCYEAEGTLSIGKQLKSALQNIDGIPTVAIIVGPEGGFSKGEYEKARDRGFLMCGLGKRILRTETAATFALSCLVYETELS